MIEKQYPDDPFSPSRRSRQSTMVSLVLKTGLVETSEQAHKVLLAIALVFSVITIYVLYGTFRQGDLVPPPPEDDMEMWESEWEHEYEG